jgi:Phosphotransferase enzyme family
MFRLGDQWAVRLPRRKSAATLIENEQTWLSLLAEQLPIPVPTPYRLGKPAQGYPWRWSVLPWLVGVAADQEEPHINQAQPFALFLRSLHRSAPFNAPLNSLRGVPLYERAASVEERMQRLETKTNLITQKIKNTWSLALSAPMDVHRNDAGFSESIATLNCMKYTLSVRVWHPSTGLRAGCQTPTCISFAWETLYFRKIPLGGCFGAVAIDFVGKHYDRGS